jgi:hypothetical protein
MPSAPAVLRTLAFRRWFAAAASEPGTGEQPTESGGGLAVLFIFGLASPTSQ